jgi:hypothetical protein
MLILFYSGGEGVNFMKNFKGGVGCKFGKKLKLFHYTP